MEKEETLDPKKLLATTVKLSGLYTNALVSTMIWLGVRLGLFRALHGAGAVTSAELAQRTGLHERWVREWLHGQAAAGIVDCEDGGLFGLSPEGAAVLVDEDHLRYLGHTFAGLPYRVEMATRLPDAFRTGLGVSWDERGAEGAELTEKTFRNWHCQVLVSEALPLLDGVVAKLEAGAAVADVGCGSGIALIEMAKAFPRSEFHGYETSAEALVRAEENKRQASATAVWFHNVAGEPLPSDERFDLITAFDCLHDMTHPNHVAQAIRAAIRPDGVWFIIDINCAPTLEENLQHPLAPLLYCMSVMGCLSAALSESGGAGLGTCGLPEPALRQLVEAAGFTRFRRLDLPNLLNAYYEVRP